MRISQLKKEHQAAHDRVKSLRKKHGLHKRTGESRLIPSLIRKKYGIHIRNNYRLSSDKTPYKELFDALMTQSYWDGRLHEKMGLNE